MNTGGEAAEQIVRMSLEGFEVAAKITGAGAKNIAILLYSILKEEKENQRQSKADEYAPFWQGAESLFHSAKGFEEVYRTGKTLWRSIVSSEIRTQRERTLR